ncbi:NAD(P)/FAD-dependent oxidoreductase [Candidatus Thorarchaeota archaeon]|nr:MAG: NAD(P)/FAD-dependent oxidoreductase [Candidatus Thorarchaeota archaeon]
MPSSSLFVSIMDHDAIVIGGGPSGLFSATEIAKEGHNVRIFEEHETIGEPDHCAGLLSSSGLKKLGLSIPDHIIQNTVSGAIIYSPSGYSITIERGRREAKVIDRRKFDAWLANRAIDCGVQISTGSRVNEFLVQDAIVQGITIKSDTNEQLKARVFIIAEGARCKLSGSIGFPTVKKSAKYPAYQYEVSGADINDEFVEMFYGHNVAPGFFAWIIPLGEGRARVGLAAKNKSKIRLDALLKHHKILSKRMRGVKIQRALGGVVLVGLPINRMSIKNTVAVGDTAGIVKATTGGGVIMGGLTARLAGKTIAGGLSESDVLERVNEYDSLCKSLVLRELKTMYFVQQALCSLNDKGLDSIIRDASDFGLLEIVRSDGDMDFQGKVIRKILRDPRMFLMGLKAIRYINPFL